MRDNVVRDLERARARTLELTDLDEPALLAQHDPLMSPLVWDLAHIGQQEELWLLRGGDPARPGMLPPDVDSLYDAFKHRRADRPALPLLPPVEARAYDHEVRGRVLDLHRANPRGCSGDLFTAGMVVQHEEQHDETMYATLQLRQGPPVLAARPLPPGRPIAERARASWPAARSCSAWTRPASRSRSTTSGPRTSWTSAPFWIGRVPVSQPAVARVHRRRRLPAAATCGPSGAGRTGSRPAWSGPSSGPPTAPAAASGSRRTCRRTSRCSTSATTRPRRSRRWCGARLPTEVEWEKACAWDPAASARRAWPWGSLAPTRRAGQPGRRGPAPRPGRRLPGQRVGLRRRAADRRRVGVDLVGLPALAGLHADDLPRPTASRSSAPTTRCCAAGRGPWPRPPIRPSFRNWDHPIRRQIFTGVRLAWDV